MTHLHSDFVSGHIDLGKTTKAIIIYGPTFLETSGFLIVIAKDNEEIPLGNIKIVVLHTPGISMESSCFLIVENNFKPVYLLTGDTLFLGDVGRPDLATKASFISKGNRKLIN